MAYASAACTWLGLGVGSWVGWDRVKVRDRDRDRVRVRDRVGDRVRVRVRDSIRRGLG